MAPSLPIATKDISPKSNNGFSKPKLKGSFSISSAISEKYWLLNLKLTTKTNKTAIDMCNTGFDNGPIKKLPKPAKTPPRLKKPCDAAMNFTLSFFSISVTKVFIEISVTPLVAPNRNKAPMRI